MNGGGAAGAPRRWRRGLICCTLWFMLDDRTTVDSGPYGVSVRPAMVTIANCAHAAVELWSHVRAWLPQAFDQNKMPWVAARSRPSDLASWHLLWLHGCTGRGSYASPVHMADACFICLDLHADAYMPCFRQCCTQHMHTHKVSIHNIT